MKIVHIVGARPQFIKMAMLSRIWRKVGQEAILHTGQHYDTNMSQQFFDELQIPEADENLGVGGGTHAEQTAAMLVGIEKYLHRSSPDLVVVYGDTNTTLAGALVAAKNHLPLAHVEAGLRSFNRSMPEEINRVLTDHVAGLLFCPTQLAVANLKNEGLTDGVHCVGDVMADALYHYSEIAVQKSKVMKNLKLATKEYSLLTLHRAGNVDDAKILKSILSALNLLQVPIIFPVHPRTQKTLLQHGLKLPGNVRAVEPVGYLDMLTLQTNAECILTDSGGIQKEAYLLRVRCITLREETEWVETVESGWNCLAGTSAGTIMELFRNDRTPQAHPNFYGDGHAAEKITEIIELIGTAKKRSE